MKNWKNFNVKFGNGYTFNDLLSYLLYPKVFEEYHQVRKEYGEVWLIPTPKIKCPQGKGHFRQTAY
jgi:pyruvate carboxylase